MTEVIYGQCDHCGKQFLTTVEAREALRNSRCPVCKRYMGRFDFNKDMRIAMRL